MPANFYRPNCQLPSGQDAGSNKDYAFSAFIHDKESSLFVFCSPQENLLFSQYFHDLHSYVEYASNW
jgi:hypothetical protein